MPQASFSDRKLANRRYGAEIVPAAPESSDLSGEALPDANASAPPGAPIEPFIDSLMAGASPAWERIGRTVACSRCGYDLRMLTEPRCPECGLIFDWRAMLVAAYDDTVGTYYERNWLRRPLRAFGSTLLASFRPKRFWKQVSIHARVRPVPLWALMTAGAVLGLLTLHGVAAAVMWATWQIPPRGRQSSEFWEFWDFLRNAHTFAASINQATRGGRTVYWRVVPVAVIGLLFATRMMLSVFRETLGRCRVRPAHMLRIAAYSAPPAMIATALLFVLGGSISMGLRSWWGAIAAIAIGMCYWTWHVRTGLRTYLGLPRALGLAAASVGVAHLAVFTAIVILNLWMQP